MRFTPPPPPPPPPPPLKSFRPRLSCTSWGLLPAVAALGLWAAPGQAANECGPLAPGLIACSSDNYDRADGNIFYEIPDADGNYRFEIRDGVVISGTRSNKEQAVPGDTVNGQPQDDHGRRGYHVARDPSMLHNSESNPHVLRDPQNPVQGSPPRTRYGGIFIDTGVEFDGNIALQSRADITVTNEAFSTDDLTERANRREGLGSHANARGISVHHYGQSGNLDLDIIAGSITSAGFGVYAEIDSRFGGANEDSEFKDRQFQGNIDIDLSPGATIRTSSRRGYGVVARHRGHGAIRLTARGTANADTPHIETTGQDAAGIDVEMGNSWDPYDSYQGTVDIDLTNYFIRTTGEREIENFSGASGLKAYNYGLGAIDIDVTGSRIETQGMRGLYAWRSDSPRGEDDGGMAIRVTDSVIQTGVEGGSVQQHAIIGQHQSASTGQMAITVDRSQITTRGPDAVGIYGRHFGPGDVMITTRSNNRITTQGANSHGIYGRQQAVRNRYTPSGNIHIDVDGGQITTEGAGSHGIYGHNESVSLLDSAMIRAQNTDIESRGGYGINAEINSSFSAIDINVDGGTVRGSEGGIRLGGRGFTFSSPHLLTISGGARVEGPQAVEFESRRGRLTLAGGHVVGNVRFATRSFTGLLNNYNDELQITGPGRLTGDIDFFGGTDTMTIDLAEDQHFVFDRTVISGLETLTQTGGGLVRFAESANFTDSALTVQDGTLVLAGTLDLGDEGTLTVHQPGRLVFEVGYGSESGVRAFQHGRIFAKSVRFADAPEEVSEVPSGRLLRSGRLRLANHVSQTDEEDSPVVFLQLGADLTATEQTAVRGQLAGLPLIYAAVTRGDGDGDEPTEVVDGQLTVQSRQADGTDQTVGHLAVDDSRVGLLTVTESAMVAQLVLPTATTTPTAPTPTSPTLPGSPPAPATPSTPTTPVSPAPPTPPLDPGPSDGDGQMGGTDSTPDPGDQNDGPDSAPEDRTGSDPGSGTATAASGGSGGSSSAGGVIGVGLLAALLAAFSGGDEATASAANYTVRPPSSASLATVNERGVLSLQEPGQAPYRLWLRTRTGGPSLAMTGAARAGVDGTEVGLRLEGAGQFHTGLSVAPTVTAQVDSLHLTAEGAVYAWNSGWRSDRYFAGLRLSHGDFEVHSRIANPMVNGALRSQARLRNTQAQLQVGGHFHAGALRFTPSAAIRMGTFAQREHVAQSPVLRARVPAVTQDYTSYQFGMQMTPDRWLDGSGGRWQPQLRWDTIRTHARGSETLQLHQSDTLGAVSFPSRASIRDLPAVVHSLSLGARVQPGGNDRTTWQFGFAGLEADGETHYAALATYQVRF